ncbi:MAG TPA: anthranilate synthase component I family protein [Polyangiaceae bacterium]
MSLSAVVVDLEPDPIAIAARFEGRTGLALLHAASPHAGPRASFVAMDPMDACSDWLPQLPSKKYAPADTRAAVPQWVGVIPYEAARSLERRTWTRTPDDRPAPHLVEPRWWRYGAVIEVDPGLGLVRVVGDDASRVRELARELARGTSRRRPRGPVRLRPLPDDDPRAHVQRVRRAQELIRAGDLYQVNLARRQRFAVAANPLDLYVAVAGHSPSPFGACLDLGEIIVCASSPELFLQLDALGHVRTAPIKGTRPRGADAEDDLRLRRELEESSKEQAELTMILDVERNDLGRVAVPGSVRLAREPAVETHRTVHHRAAVVAALLRPERSALELLRAMFPSGSVTGAPKIRAMEVIAELEPARRGLYTGAFGSIAADGSLRLAMAIRVFTVRAGEGHYFAGGGIVADSDPEAELAETRWKGTQIERLAAESGNLA